MSGKYRSEANQMHGGEGKPETMTLEEAIAQLEEVMKTTQFFEIPEPHKGTILSKGNERFDRWSADEDGKTLECPVCRNNFNIKMILEVVPERKNFREMRLYSPEFYVSLQKSRDEREQWAVCSDECETIFQLRLNGINDEKRRESDMLRESKRLQKAARKLAGLNKQKSDTTVE
jgi:hypothetical protein